MTEVVPKKRRLAIALEIRAAAMKIIESEGSRLTVQGRRLIESKWRGLSILYTPHMPMFSNRRNDPEFPPEMPRLLDIWWGNKVFSMRWNDEGLVHLCNFKRGDWETLLQSPLAPLSSDTCISH